MSEENKTPEEVFEDVKKNAEGRNQEERGHEGGKEIEEWVELLEKRHVVKRAMEAENDADLRDGEGDPSDDAEMAIGKRPAVFDVFFRGEILEVFAA